MTSSDEFKFLFGKNRDMKEQTNFFLISNKNKCIHNEKIYIKDRIYKHFITLSCCYEDVKES